MSAAYDHDDLCTRCGQGRGEHGWAGRLGCQQFIELMPDVDPSPLARQYEAARRRNQHLPESWSLAPRASQGGAQ